MAMVIATGRIERPDLIPAEMVTAENTALAELGRTGAVDAAYLHEGRAEVTIVLSADDVESAAAVLEQLPLVAGKQMRVHYASVLRRLV
jgi:hypothetical protein